MLKLLFVRCAVLATAFTLPACGNGTSGIAALPTTHSAAATLRATQSLRPSPDVANPVPKASMQPSLRGDGFGNLNSASTAARQTQSLRPSPTTANPAPQASLQPSLRGDGFGNLNSVPTAARQTQSLRPGPDAAVPNVQPTVQPSLRGDGKVHF